MAGHCGNYCQKYKLNFVGIAKNQQKVKPFPQENLNIYKIGFFFWSKEEITTEDQ